MRDADAGGVGSGRAATCWASSPLLVRLTTTLMLVASGSSGCEKLRAEPTFTDACKSLGMCDTPPKPAVMFDVLIDASRGSSGTKDHVEGVLDPVLTYAAERPASVVRTWVLGKTVGETEAVGQVTAPAPPRGSLKAKRDAASRFVRESKSALMVGLAPALGAEPVRRSPIAAALSKIALAGAGTGAGERHVVAVTDAREVSAELGDFECGRLPTEARFLTLLHDRSLLLPGSFKGASAEFVFVELKPIPERGCAVEVARELRLRALWTAALKEAGAREVRLSAGGPQLADDATSAPLAKEVTP